MKDTSIELKDPKARAAALYLASASAARVRILANAGISFVAEPASVDEAEMKRSLAAEGAGPVDVAAALAELKARKIAARHEGAFVIGADQVLECNGVVFGKPGDLDHARAQLLALRGKTHRLVSAVCLMRDERVIWHDADTAELTMRNFSDAFLDAYLASVGEAACAGVGAYQLEGPGAQLFSRVRGDYFTILGLPLLPLLGVLREHGVAQA
ncbi:MAG: Maf family protein [Alphaproteobacteria bacterium]